MEDHPTPQPPVPTTSEPRRRTARAIAAHFMTGALIGLILAIIAVLYYTEFGELTIPILERVGAIALVFGLLAAMFGETLVDSKPLRGLAKFLDSFPTVF